MDIKVIDIKNLRKLTGASVNNCKKALIKSNNNIDLAILWLRDQAFGGNRFNEYKGR